MIRKNTESIRIAIAEHSVIVRSGIAAVLKRLPDLTVKTIEVTSPEALEDTLHTDIPDLLIVNPSFGGGFDLQEFRADPIHRQLKCVALTNHTAITPIGYDSCISLDTTIDSLAAQIQSLLQIVPTAEADTDTAGSPLLSQREKEIVVCVVKGMTNKEIAENLFLSVHTVITHRRNIARKLDIRSTAGLTIYAIVNKLVDISEVKL